MNSSPVSARALPGDCRVAVYDLRGGKEGEDYSGLQRESGSYDLLQFAFSTFVGTPRS